MIEKLPFCTFLRAVAVGTLLMSIPTWAGAEERVLLDFNMKTPPPAGWAVEGYAFGTHNPTPAERQKQALGTRNQRYVQKGRMTSPEFTIESDYLKIDCAGTYHPTEVAVVLMVDGKDLRSCSPDPGNKLNYSDTALEVK